jgi:hypothetical protein
LHGIVLDVDVHRPRSLSGFRGGFDGRRWPDLADSDPGADDSAGGDWLSRSRS